MELSTWTMKFQMTWLKRPCQGLQSKERKTEYLQMTTEHQMNPLLVPAIWN